MSGAGQVTDLRVSKNTPRVWALAASAPHWGHVSTAWPVVSWPGLTRPSRGHILGNDNIEKNFFDERFFRTMFNNLLIVSLSKKPPLSSSVSCFFLKRNYFCFHSIILWRMFITGHIFTLVRCPGASDVSNVIMSSLPGPGGAGVGSHSPPSAPGTSQRLPRHKDTKPIIHTGDKQRHNNTQWCHNHSMIEVSKVPIHLYSLHKQCSERSGNFTKIDVSPSKNIDMSQLCDPHCQYHAC